jgi:predicted Zn-dependent protease
MTIFSKPRNRARYNERMFDPRITMSSDPADPEGGFAPFFYKGYANPAMTWTEKGILKSLAYDSGMGVSLGRKYSDNPTSLRLSGGTTEIDQMIAQCDEGIFVNRFSAVDLVDWKTMMLTGVTRDGCFLVKNGKIDRPVKNFRFLESPAFMLNKLVTMGKARRAAYGYTPSARGEPTIEWPRAPMIVPPMMIHDFNFSAMADAV